MGIFNSPKSVADEGAPTSPTTEKPLPSPRPGTSGTENLLMTNRRAASATYQKAQRVERAYRARKRATVARADWTDAKNHFRQSFHHAGNGLRMIVALVKGAPYLIAEKRELARAGKDEQKRRRAIKKKKRLEEKIAAEEAATRDSGSDLDESDQD